MNISESSPIISQKSLGVVVLACVLLAAWFIPDQDELIHRLDQDGEATRLKELTAQRMAERQELLVTGTDRQKLHVWLELVDEELRDDPVILADRRSLCATTNVPLELGEELFAHAKNISATVLDSFADSLVKRALGMERPAEAAALLRTWGEVHPSWNIVTREIQAWRWAGQPAQAFTALNGALTKSPPEGAAPSNMDDLRIKLALESNQPKVAFGLMAEKYLAAPSAEKSALLRHLVEMAPQTNSTDRASALIAEHVKDIPFHTATLNEALQLVNVGKAFQNPAQEADYQYYASAMARWQEWADRGEAAFGTWAKLSLLGNAEAWARALDLQEDLLKTDDFAIILADRIAHGQQLNKEPLLADILLDQGRLSEAVAHYENAAKKAADPTPIFKQLGRIHQQSGEWKLAITAFGEVLKHNAKDAEAQKGRAFALVRLHHYEEACEAYIALARQAPSDAEAQETCATLCDSLGHPKEALEASQRLLNCASRKSTPEEHLDLADQYRFLGDDEGQIATLRNALAQFSGSTRVRFTLAESLGAKGNHDEAITLLADASMQSDPASVNLLISEAMESANALAVVHGIKSAPPACLAKLPDVQLRLAYLYERVGLGTEGTQIVSNLQNNDAFRQTYVWEDLAKVCVDFDDTPRAESFALLHVSALGRRDSKAWELLGDIYTAEDRTTEADAAYKKAVEMLGAVTLRAEPVPPEISQAKVF